mgnify:CR=1 FL=1
MDGERDKSLVWLEDGREESFEPAAPMRPWLEESLQWAAHDEPAPEPPEPKGSKLIWL